MNKLLFSTLGAFALMSMVSCSDKDTGSDAPSQEEQDALIKEMTYAGGELGTTFITSAYAYRQPTPATENAGMSQQFKNGETLFERDFVQTKGQAFSGLGPLMVRNGCLYCHPAYGHGKRQTRYRANDMGNGYLLVLFENVDGKSTYLSSVTGMPQTLAVKPFKAPIDETKIKIEWKEAKDEWGNKFDDGETYGLIYPEVTIPADAYYVPIQATVNGKTETLTVDQVDVRLESTIGIYGTGLTDAIPDDSITAQWKAESPYCTLNPAMWNQETNTWNSYYSNSLQGDGTKFVRRYTYALSRGPILDAAGANAIWNITNVTRSDRRYHYMTAAYALRASQDPDVQKDFYTYFPEKKVTGNVETDIYNYLMGKDQEVEMSDDDYWSLMIWHRGLAVPAARDMDDATVQEGRVLFSQIGCANCHRPSWTTGEDHIQDPAKFFKYDAQMPRYPHQKIWPYTDFVQHRLFMENDIRTGWCRTTPLWGRGLSKVCTGAEDRLHDCRARNTMEAIMWHGYSSKSDGRKSVENFRKLTKEQRNAIIKFVESV